MQTKTMRIADLAPAPYNPRKISDRALEGLRNSVRRFGVVQPIIFNERSGRIVGGHQRVKALQAEKTEETDVVVVDLSDDDEKALNVALNNQAIQGEWTEDIVSLLGEIKASDAELFGDLRLDDLENELRAELKGEDAAAAQSGEDTPTLAERFGVPPFSVLDARQGYWQDRKRQWLGLGIRSESGRGEDALARRGKIERYEAIKSGRPLTWVGRGRNDEGLDDTSRRILGPTDAGTSIFDPVLCELAYRWFCPLNGSILDPFAGGSVRGIVASKLGRNYAGVDLRPEQCEANHEQAARICKDPQPIWVTGDSRDIRKLAPGAYDLVFSCPPYADLERYSDDPADLSTLDYDEFLKAYRAIIAESCAMLRADRFAAFVVGDVRDARGNYHNFTGDTVAAFLDAGLSLYNEAILVTMVASLPLRVGSMFSKSRKLGKTHQNVYVFVKGDARRATEACGPVEIVEILESESEAAS